MEDSTQYPHELCPYLRILHRTTYVQSNVFSAIVGWKGCRGWGGVYSTFDFHAGVWSLCPVNLYKAQLSCFFNNQVFELPELKGHV